MDASHPTPEEMTAALLAAAEAGRWSHWEHELEAHARDWVKVGDMPRPLRPDELANLPAAVARYPFVHLCAYRYSGRIVWGFYARRLPFREWVLTNVLVVYDPVAEEIIHCMWPRHKKRYCERWGEQSGFFVRVRW